MTTLSLLILSSAANLFVAETSQPLKQWIGRCEPVNAVVIMNQVLTEGKTDAEAFAAVVEARSFDGSKACIDFIREASMNMRKGYPKTFQSLWMDGTRSDKHTRSGVLIRRSP